MSFAGSNGINYKATTSTTSVYPQGFTVLDLVLHRDGMFMYGHANGALTIYDWVKIDNDGEMVQLTTAISASEPTQVGAVQVAFADNDYGWAFVGMGGGLGKGIQARFLTLYAEGAKVYSTATAGVADDTATDLIQGAVGLATVGGSTDDIEIHGIGILKTNCQD